jgi:hypothetical protein
MVYRKGELHKGQIDREWPHQVALRADLVSGANFPIVDAYSRNLSRCPRGHTFMREGTYYVVYCFAVRADAELFRDHFSGEIIDPKDRPRWPGASRGRG